jgi:serine protease Do
VRFSDGREYRASVVGSDPDSDLAVLKLDAPGEKFQPLEFADSDKVRVGDWVLAIGSPFGYNNSVSAGIVSAKHRVANVDQPYQDFIQTDAAINPGNSGGALVDLSGRVVGINAAIVSNTRAFEGIGLAISANLTKWVAERLMKEGKVRRGYLGIFPYDLNAELVTVLRQDGIRSVDDLLADVGLESARGVFIVRVPDGPAAKAGVRAGDVIVEIDGRPVPHKQELFFMIAQLEPGRVVKVKLLRDRKARDIDVEIAERPPTPPRRR